MEIADDTDFREFDLRYPWTSDVLGALDRALEQLASKYDDGLDIVECADETIGIGCVALQTYIGNALKALREVFAHAPSVTILRQQRSPVVGNSGCTVVDVVWACANYYKHHDEWPNWNSEGRRKETIDVLAKVRISESTNFRCVEVLRSIQGDNVRMTDVLHTLSAWRESWIAELRRRAAEPRVAAALAAPER
jgi:hypothetical protein